MANQDQVMIGLDFSRVNVLFHYMETLHTQTSEMIMCLQSLQKNTQDSRKRFIDSLTKPYFQEQVVRFKETSNEIQHVSKRVSDICLGDDEDFNPAGQSGDAAMRAKRLFFGSIVMKAFEDMMGLGSSVLEDHNLTPYNYSKNRLAWCDIECHKRFECVFLITN